MCYVNMQLFTRLDLDSMLNCFENRALEQVSNCANLFQMWQRWMVD